MDGMFTLGFVVFDAAQYRKVKKIGSIWTNKYVCQSAIGFARRVWIRLLTTDITR